MATDVVMISVDDLFNVDKFRDAFGVSIQTPNFDRLKDMGVTFSNAYASTALCNPSRTSILTGQNPFETGVHENRDVWYEKVSPAATVPAILMDAGYASLGIGKLFHTPEMPAGVTGRIFNSYITQKNVEAPAIPGIGFGPLAGGGSTDALTISAAIQSLQGASPVDPLLLMVGLADPHWPWLAPQEFLDLYPLDQIVVPPWDGVAPAPYVLQMLQDGNLAAIRQAGQMPALIQAYLADISEMDAQLGQLLDAIQISGRDPAIVLFSDHGYSLGDHDMIGKFNLWEQAANAPLIFYHPSVTQPGTVVDGVVSLLDIAPTLLEIAGLPVPPGMDGRSLLPTILDPSVFTSGLAFTTMWGSFSIRTDDYRFTRYEDGSIELFDIASDPANAFNLHGNAAFSAIEASLLQQLDAMLAELGVTYDSVNQITIYDRANGDTDYFAVDSSSVAALVDGNGIDTVYAASARVDLAPWAENAVATSLIDHTIVGNARENSLVGSDGNDVIYGFWGNDDLIGGLGKDKLLGGHGNDRLLGQAGDDILNGADGNDLLKGGDHNDRLLGGAGNDRLWGETGSDRLQGDAGNDQLVGASGSDYLIGGAGRDAFVFLSTDTGTDTIADFARQFDRIVLRNVAPADVDIRVVGADTFLSFGNETIRIVNVTGLATDDLTFV